MKLYQYTKVFEDGEGGLPVSVCAENYKEALDILNVRAALELIQVGIFAKDCSIKRTGKIVYTGLFEKEFRIVKCILIKLLRKLK